MKNDTIKKCEDHFKMPFIDIINVLHIENGVSLNELGKQSGATRQSITSNAKRLGLKTRSVKEANKLTDNKGENHYAFGSNKYNSERCRINSDRMIKNNPIRKPEVQEKRAITISKTFIDLDLPQEKLFAEILDSVGVKYERQTPFGPYNLDFYIEDINQAIEIDSTDKWGGNRYKNAEKRDIIMLCDYGVETLRINKRFLTDRVSIIKILKANNIIS